MQRVYLYSRRFLLRLFSIFAYRRFLWRALAVYRTASFRANRSEFHIRTTLNDTVLETRVFWTLFRLTLPAIFRAAVTVVVVILLSGFFVSLSETPSWIRSFFEQVPTENSGANDGLFILIVTVVGIFLTLYLTNINTIMGTLYAEMPKRIRNLLLQEKVGNVYINFLVFLTILSLLFLAVGVVFNIRPKVVVIIGVLLGCMAVLAFAQLAKRSFQFFDPTSFVDFLTGELSKWSSLSTINGYHWNDITFQTHYNKQAVEAILAVQQLAQITFKKEHIREEGFVGFTSKLSQFIVLYLRQKRTIPNNSRWYTFTPRQKQWYLTDYSSVSLATNTQTSIQPEMKPDHHWLERELLNIHIGGLKEFISQLKLRFDILSALSFVSQSLGGEWEVEEGERLLNLIALFELNIIKPNPEPVMSDEDRHHFLETVASLDALSLLPIGLLLGFVKSIDALHLEQVSVRIAQCNWLRDKSIYSIGCPTCALEALEYVQQRVKFEIEAEGKIVSPTWYLRQTILQPIAYSLFKQVNCLLNLYTEFFVKQVQQMIKQEKQIFAVGLLFRGLEYHNKLRHHLHVFQMVAEQLEQTRILKEMRWPEWNWKEVINKSDEGYRAIIISLLDCMPSILIFSQTEGLPDYLGQAVNLFGQAYFKALAENDLEMAMRIFPKYLIGTMTLIQNIQEKTTDMRPADAIYYWTEPLIDLFELSGCAYIMAEFHQNNNLWNTCKQIWDNYLASVPLKDILAGYAAIISHNRWSPFLTTRSVMRTEWEQRLNDLFRSLPRKTVLREFGNQFLPPSTVFVHPSLFTRAIGGRSGADFLSLHIIDRTDLFSEMYLSTFPDASGLDFGNRRSVAQMLDDQREWEEAHNLDFSNLENKQNV